MDEINEQRDGFMEWMDVNLVGLLAGWIEMMDGWTNGWIEMMDG